MRGGVRVDVIEELKFFGKIQTKKIGGWGVGSGGGGGVGLVGGVKVDVNEELKFCENSRNCFFLGGLRGGGVGLVGGGGSGWM